MKSCLHLGVTRGAKEKTFHGLELYVINYHPHHIIPADYDYYYLFSFLFLFSYSPSTGLYLRSSVWEGNVFIHSMDLNFLQLLLDDIFQSH